LVARGRELRIGSEFYTLIPSTTKHWNWGIQFQIANSELNSVHPNTAYR
jgi:hypothetical protein